MQAFVLPTRSGQGYDGMHAFVLPTRSGQPLPAYTWLGHLDIICRVHGQATVEQTKARAQRLT